MAAERPHRLNVIGPFYVVDGCCTACGVPEAEAPQLFASDDSRHCYVRKQPSDAEQLRQMINAIACAELPCIRYRGQDQEVLSALRSIGGLDQHDQAESSGFWQRIKTRLRARQR